VKHYLRTTTLSFTKRDDDETVMDIAVSSESDENERWFGREILLHTNRSVDLKRVRAVGAWLKNHDPDQIIGAIVDARVDKDRVLRAGIRFDETPGGKEAQLQVKSGSLKGASIRYGYGPGDFDEVLMGQSKKIGDRTIQGPARIVNRWEAFEFTLTPIPADAHVGVGRNSRSNRMFKWKIVAADESWERRFNTKKEADAFAESSEDECRVVKIDGESGKSGDPIVDNMDIDKLTRELTVKLDKESAERVAAIIDAAAIGGMTAVAVRLIGENPNISVREATKKLHDVWAEKQKDTNGRGGNPEPPAPRSPTRMTDTKDDILAETLRRRDWAPDVEVGGNMLGLLDLRALLSNDEGDFDRRTQQLLREKKITPQQLSLQGMYRGLGRVPAKQWINDVDGSKRAITTTAFAILTGNTVVAAIRDAYEAVPRIGEKLTMPFASNAQTDTIVGVLTEATIKKIAEGKEYEEAGAVEEYVTVGHQKQGGIIRVTDEMIRFDQTGQFLMKLNTLAVDAAEAIEQLIVDRVTDAKTASGEYVYRPSGTATALYSTTARTRGTNGVAVNALVDTTDLDNARALLAGMKRHNGKPVLVAPNVMLVPDALLATAVKILGSELIPGTENELNPWGTRGRWRPMLLSSPFMDLNSTSTWFLGDPQKQFKKKEVLGMETTTMGAGSAEMFTHDIVFMAKVRFDTEVFCDDYVHFVQSTA